MPAERKKLAKKGYTNADVIKMKNHEVEMENFVSFRARILRQLRGRWWGCSFSDVKSDFEMIVNATLFNLLEGLAQWLNIFM